MYSAAHFARLLADLISAGIGVWGIRVLLSKQHSLRGATRALRWTVVVIGFIMFTLWPRRSLAPMLGLSGLLLSALFFLFPDVSYYLAIGYQKLRGRPSRVP